MDPRQFKPELWAFEPSQVDPQWWDFWRNMRFFAPLWEGGANRPFDIAGRTTATSLGAMTWVPGQKGIALQRASGLPTLFPYNAKWEFDLNDFTIGYYGNITGVTGNNFSTIVSTNEGGSAFTAGWAIQSGGGNTNLVYQEGSSASGYDSGFNIQDGKDHLVVIEVTLNTVTFWVDGIKVNSQTRTTNTGTSYSQMQLMEYADIGSHGTTGELYYVFAAQGILGPDFHQGLAQDPFGPMRLDSDVTATNTVATDFTLSPSTQSVVAGQTTGNYSMSLTGSNPGSNVNVALTDGGSGGVFAPTSLTFTSGGSGTQTFVYTPPSGASPGTITLQAVATGGLSATHTTNCVVVASATDFTITPSNQNISTGGTTGNYTVTFNAPIPLVGVSVALTLSGTPGGSVSATPLVFAVGGSTSQTFTYTAGGSGGTETITGTASGGLTTNHSVTATVSAGVLTAGTITVGTITQSSVALSATSATGGTGPYTQQWYRTPILNFTPGPSTILTGKTALSIADTTVKPGFKYQYTLVYKDSVGATVTATLVSALVPPYVIGFVGDSLTNSSGGETTNGDSPQQFINSYQAAIGSNTVTFSNKGVSGETTTDWLPTDPNSTGDFSAAVSAFNTAGVQIILLMLGTNNARTDRNISIATTQSDLAAICAGFIAQVPTLLKIIINQPPWFDGSRFFTVTGNNVYVGQLPLLQSYNPAYPAVCDNVKIFLGDVMGMQLANASNQGTGGPNVNGPGLLTDGLHYNNLGDVLLGGTLWWDAFAAILYPTTSSGGGGGTDTGIYPPFFKSQI